jgi:hypothetical protein
MRPAVAHEDNDLTVVCWRCRTRETAYHDDLDRYDKFEHLEHLLYEHDHGESDEPEFVFQIFAPGLELEGVDTAHGIRVLVLDVLDRRKDESRFTLPIDVNVQSADESCEAEYEADRWTLTRMASTPTDFHPLQVGS